MIEISDVMRSAVEAPRHTRGNASVGCSITRSYVLKNPPSLDLKKVIMIRDETGAPRRNTLCSLISPDITEEVTKQPNEEATMETTNIKKEEDTNIKKEGGEDPNSKCDLGNDKKEEEEKTTQLHAIVSFHDSNNYEIQIQDNNEEEMMPGLMIRSSDTENVLLPIPGITTTMTAAGADTMDSLTSSTTTREEKSRRGWASRLTGSSWTVGANEKKKQWGSSGRWSLSSLLGVRSDKRGAEAALDSTKTVDIEKEISRIRGSDKGKIEYAKFHKALDKLIQMKKNSDSTSTSTTKSDKHAVAKGIIMRMAMDTLEIVPSHAKLIEKILEEDAREYQCSTKNSERMLKSALEIGEKINERVEMLAYLSSCQRCLECEIENYTRLRASIMNRIVVEDEKAFRHNFKPTSVEAQL